MCLLPCTHKVNLCLSDMFKVPDAPEMHQELHNSEVSQDSCSPYPFFIQAIVCNMSKWLLCVCACTCMRVAEFWGKQWSTYFSELACLLRLMLSPQHFSI